MTWIPAIADRGRRRLPLALLPLRAWLAPFRQGFDRDRRQKPTLGIAAFEKICPASRFLRATAHRRSPRPHRGKQTSTLDSAHLRRHPVERLLDSVSRSIRDRRLPTFDTTVGELSADRDLVRPRHPHSIEFVGCFRSRHARGRDQYANLYTRARRTVDLRKMFVFEGSVGHRTGVGRTAWFVSSEFPSRTSRATSSLSATSDRVLH